MLFISFLYYFYLIIFFDYVLFLYFLLLILYPFFAFLSLYLSRSVSLQASYFDFAFILSLDLLSRSHSLGVPRLAVFFLVFIIFHNYLHFVFFLSLCLACTSSFPFANRVSVCVCVLCLCVLSMWFILVGVAGYISAYIHSSQLACHSPRLPPPPPPPPGALFE